MKTITTDQQLQLQGLKQIANKFNEELDGIYKTAREVLNDEDVHGWISDFVFSDLSLEEFLDALEKSGIAKPEKGG